MANSSNTQILIDGPRNVVVKVVGTLDAGDLAPFVILDPATLDGIDWSGSQKATKLRIKEVQYSISSQMTVNLLWDAAVPVLALALAGLDDMAFEEMGGIVNNAGAGVTGKILLSTSNWANGTKTFTIVLRCVKQQS